MNLKSYNSEKGQAIVYLVIGLVVFLGFVALAIDGGMVLADRRHTQNAADAASLAGGGQAALSLENNHVYSQGWSCSDPNVVSAMGIAVSTAIARAASNNFTIDNNISDHNGVIATCGSVNHGFYMENYIDVTVDISSTTQSNFAQLLFPNALKNVMEAVTRIHPRQPLAFGYAIVALNPSFTCSGNGKNGAAFSGASGTNVNGGGIFSNGCLEGNGAAGNITVTNGNISWAHLGVPGNKQFIPDPIGHVAEMTLSAYDVQLPNCTGRWFTDFPNPAKIDPGLYCFHGSLDFKKGPYNGTGITIYVEGKVSINGNQQVALSAVGAPSPAIPGILFYLPSTNQGPVKLNGTSDVTLTGTILAPGADIDISGDTGIHAFRSQIIGLNVKVTGSGLLILDYEPRENANLPTSIELFK
jgi:Flp pilus assembly protein TadG